MNNLAGPDPAVIDAINRGNQVVFFDVAMGEADSDNDNGQESSIALGRIKLELFVKDVSFWHVCVITSMLGFLVAFYLLCTCMYTFPYHNNELIGSLHSLYIPYCPSVQKHVKTFGNFALVIHQEVPVLAHPLVISIQRFIVY